MKGMSLAIAAVAVCTMGSARAERFDYGRLLVASLEAYVADFNRTDAELYTNSIPNSAAAEFLAANVPRFSCPDKEIERTYCFRWWTFRKHLKRTSDGWVITEFLPPVGWAGKHNTIVCPAGHHLREGRWLRDPRYVTEDVRFWLSDPDAKRFGYSSWLFTGAKAIADVTGDRGLVRRLLDDAIRYFETWERGIGRPGPAMGGGDGSGLYQISDNQEGTEISLSGYGYRPLLNSAMWSEAKTIAAVAREAGRQDVAARFEAKAAVLEGLIKSRLWNPERQFFTTVRTNGTQTAARELHGYAPWYFGMELAGYEKAWERLGAEGGFRSKWGLTFPERSTPGFTIAYTGHECQWNGPSWPFATSVALTAYANYLHGNPLRDRRLFGELLHDYAASHVRTREDGTVVPWIDENQNPDTGEWLARAIILRTPKMVTRNKPERGKDYNHSTFCDLVISGLVGVIPTEEGLAVDPLAPASWDSFALEGLRFRGHDVSVRWNRTDGGLSVAVDGRTVASRSDLGVLNVSLDRSGK